MRWVVAAAAAITVTSTSAARADSPITSTSFAAAYANEPIVARAAKQRVLDDDVARYLMAPSNPVDVKAAVVNALGWDIDGNSNADRFLDALAAKYGRRPAALRKDYATILHPHEILAWGYLLVLDDYFHPRRAIPVLETAARRIPDSYTAAMLAALAKAQQAMDSDWCRVWQLAAAVDTNTKLQRDLRPKARKIVLDYMALYKDECDAP